MKNREGLIKISLGSTLVVALLNVVQLPTVAQSGESPPHKTLGVIINSGSTNACPYTISVSRSGQATYSVCDTQGTGEIPSTLTTKFFDDIKAAKPLSQLPYTSCAKSVSFGTTTKVKYRNQTSPDISCPSSDSKVTDLYEDAAAIQQALGFSVSKR